VVPFSLSEQSGERSNAINGVAYGRWPARKFPKSKNFVNDFEATPDVVPFSLSEQSGERSNAINGVG
jgi:hypothetical protein